MDIKPDLDRIFIGLDDESGEVAFKLESSEGEEWIFWFDDLPRTCLFAATLLKAAKSLRINTSYAKQAITEWEQQLVEDADDGS